MSESQPDAHVVQSTSDDRGVQRQLLASYWGLQFMGEKTVYSLIMKDSRIGGGVS